MSVLCPILSIIVRKIPNSRGGALARSQVPTPSLPGIGRVVARKHLVDRGAPPCCQRGRQVGDDDDQVVMTITGVLRNARLRLPPRPTFAQTRSDMLRP